MNRVHYIYLYNRGIGERGRNYYFILSASAKILESVHIYTKVFSTNNVLLLALYGLGYGSKLDLKSSKLWVLWRIISFSIVLFTFSDFTVSKKLKDPITVYLRGQGDWLHWCLAFVIDLGDWLLPSVSFSLQLLPSVCMRARKFNSVNLLS